MAAYNLIATTTVDSPSGASTIEFAFIPQTYTDLQLVINGRSTGAVTADNINLKFNGSSTGYSTKNLWGNGSAVQNDSSSALSYLYGSVGVTGASATALVFGNSSFYIPNYAGSTNKSVSMDLVTENNATLAYAVFVAGLWSNTEAINKITMTLNTGPAFAQYSSASLYGIKNS
jgi:hypothetical protein